MTDPRVLVFEAPNLISVSSYFDVNESIGKPFVKISISINVHQKGIIEFNFKIFDFRDVYDCFRSDQKNEFEPTEKQKELIRSLSTAIDVNSSLQDINPAENIYLIQVLVALIEESREKGLVLISEYFSPRQINDICPQ